MSGGRPEPRTPARSATRSVAGGLNPETWTRFPPALVALALFLLITAIYLPSLRNDFVYDDETLILKYPRPGSARELLHVFAERHFPNLPYYRPVTRLTIAAQKLLHGDNPRPYHLFNALLMGLAAVAAWDLLRRPVFGLGAAPAFLGAALFAAHPIASSCVYPVCSGRETLLPALLMLVATSAFLRAGRRGYWLAMAALTLAVFAKEQAVVLPLVFALADALGLTAFDRRGGARRWLARYAPVLPVFLLYLVLRYRLFRGEELVTALSAHPLGPVLSYLYALQVVFAPFLELVYEPPVAVWWSPPRLAAAGAVVAAAALLARPAWPRLRRPVLFWLGWFLVLQLPTANLLVQEAKFDERYVFLASLGLIAIGAALVMERLRGRQQVAPPTFARPVGDGVPMWEAPPGGDPAAPVRRVAACAASALVALLAAVSVARGVFFRNDLDFSRQWTATNPRSAIAQCNLGNELMERGDLAGAEAALRRALEIAPEMADAQYNLGIALFRLGQPAAAIERYHAALRINPAYDAHCNLGLALAATGATNEAIAAYHAAIERTPRDARPVYNLGVTLAALARYDEARDWFARAMQLDPRDADAAYNLGAALERLERPAEAIDAYAEAVRRRPDHANAHFNLANLLYRSGRLAEAAAHYEAVVRISPDDDQARANLQATRRALAEP